MKSVGNDSSRYPRPHVPGCCRNSRQFDRTQRSSCRFPHPLSHHDEIASAFVHTVLDDVSCHCFGKCCVTPSWVNIENTSLVWSCAFSCVVEVSVPTSPLVNSDPRESEDFRTHVECLMASHDGFSLPSPCEVFHDHPVTTTSRCSRGRDTLTCMH